MAFAALLTVVRDFEANTVRVSEECCRVVRSVLRVKLSRCRIDSGAAELLGNSVNFGCGIYTQAEVMQSWRIRLVPCVDPGWAQDKAEVAIEVLDMWIINERELVFAKPKRFDEHLVVKAFRLRKVGHGDVDVIDSCDLGHRMFPGSVLK